MRTGEERLRFCGTICAAARQLNIAIGSSSMNGECRYIWADRMTGGAIKCPPADNRKSALEAACDALVDYLNQPK